mmetsp:Transcript_38198/g.89802  ORF Transcript_38198/g.89802 Transcript_38198/m.89802 type:complete len:255 (+) Transcript_38198:1312-2076(+)
MLLMPLGREVDAARVEAHVLVLRYGGGAAALGLVLVPQHTAARQAAPVIEEGDGPGQHAHEGALARVDVAHDRDPQVEVVALRRQLAHDEVRRVRHRVRRSVRRCVRDGGPLALALGAAILGRVVVAALLVCRRPLLRVHHCAVARHRVCHLLDAQQHRLELLFRWHRTHGHEALAVSVGGLAHAVLPRVARVEREAFERELLRVVGLGVSIRDRDGHRPHRWRHEWRRSWCWSYRWLDGLLYAIDVGAWRVLR